MIHLGYLIDRRWVFRYVHLGWKLSARRMGLPKLRRIAIRGPTPTKLDAWRLSRAKTGCIQRIRSYERLCKQHDSTLERATLRWHFLDRKIRKVHSVTIAANRPMSIRSILFRMIHSTIFEGRVFPHRELSQSKGSTTIRTGSGWERFSREEQSGFETIINIVSSPRCHPLEQDQLDHRGAEDPAAHGSKVQPLNGQDPLVLRDNHCDIADDDETFRGRPELLRAVLDLPVNAWPTRNR